METIFSHYKYMAIWFSALKGKSGPIQLEFELIRDIIPVCVTCKFDED